jgi:g-D-glutamyl-meso-diaminopimelate peptidase
MWEQELGHLPVMRYDAAQLFFAVEQREEEFEDYLNILVSQGVFSEEGIWGELLREELYRLMERLEPGNGNSVSESYFLGVTDGDFPVDFYARLGIIAVPFDRQYRPEDVVTRQETVFVAARAAQLALRGNNAPVVVQPKQRYTYETMRADLQRLATAYPERLTLQVIGESVEGRAIYAMRLGTGETEIFLDGSNHASEWLTTPLLMKMLEEYVHHAEYGYPFGKYDVAGLLEEVTFWFIPMVNPDGVTLVLEGPGAVEHGDFVRQVAAQNGSLDFSDWKANIRGVDLNRQFPIGWQRMVNIKRTAAPSHFKGSAPMSEPEASALFEFTLARRPAMVLSYHQQGDIIFWYYRQDGEQLARDRRIVREMAALTGYSWEFYLTNGGKYRDWVIRELGVPALIMEVGQRIGDLGEWDRIWRQNRYGGLKAAELILQELDK